MEMEKLNGFIVRNFTRDLLSFLISASFVLLLILSLTGCEDYENGYTNEDFKKIDFSNNFESRFGTVDKNQSWDLSQIMPRTAKYKIEDESAPLTRAAISGYTEGTASDILNRPASTEGWYSVESATIDWLNANLKEKVNNTTKGKAFALKAPANDFAIIPIYQGEAGMKWDLHFVDKNTNQDYKVWSKSQGIKYQDNESSEWQQPTNDDWKSCSTIGKNAIIGEPMIFDVDKVGGHEFFLYLDITKGQLKADNNGTGDYATTGTKQRSDEGMMLSLNCPIPTNLDKFTSVDNSLVMLVGCEDSDLADSDWDLNDVVFLIVGYPAIPDLVEITRKRYMCEDLGNTYDFDFNDIVIDVTQTAIWKASKENGAIVRTEQPDVRTQTATIKYLCGTLPLEATIGNTCIGTISSPADHAKTMTELGSRTTDTGYYPGWTPNVSKSVDGWDSNSNNITINVGTTKLPNETVFTEATRELFEKAVTNANGEIYTIDFPGTGKTPLIIAVDQTVDWMAEGVHIPDSWCKAGLMFDIKTQYVVTLNVNDPTMGRVEGAGTFEENQSTTIKAIPNSGYIFVKWSDGDTNAERQLSMKQNYTLTAIFKAIPQYTISVAVADGQSNYGSVSGGGTVTEGSSVTITATPNQGYKVKAWYKDGAVISGKKGKTLTVTADGNATYTVEFEVNNGEVLYKGNFSEQGYGSRLNIEASAFADVEAGTLTINFSALTKSTKFEIQTGWSQTLSCSTKTIEAGSTSCTFTLTDDDITKLQQQGMVIIIENQGGGINISSVTIK